MQSTKNSGTFSSLSDFIVALVSMLLKVMFSIYSVDEHDVH